jgi:putative membrane protein
MRSINQTRIRFWAKPLGRKTLGLSKEDAEISKTLAANQGLYNGFLAGLALALLA